jgi:hypothetical protein
MIKKYDADTEERLSYLEQISRTKVLRSCHEMAQHGVDRNDFYLIDPDGQLIGNPPILAYCNFETKVTEIVHDSEELLKIEHCDTIGCDKHDIQYGVVMSQLQSLIQLSETCEQVIDFGCFLAPLSFEKVNFGSWLDKNGKS